MTSHVFLLYTRHSYIYNRSWERYWEVLQLSTLLCLTCSLCYSPLYHCNTFLSLLFSFVPLQYFSLFVILLCTSAILLLSLLELTKWSPLAGSLCQSASLYLCCSIAFWKFHKWVQVVFLSAFDGKVLVLCLKEFCRFFKTICGFL